MLKFAFTLSKLGAVWPQYIEGIGNRSTLLTMDNEEIVITPSPLSLMRKLLSSEGIDLTLYRKMSTQITTSKQSFPIVVGEQVFMTFKARRARVTGDQVYGYVRLDLVEQIVEVGGHTEIQLVNGMKLYGEEKAVRIQRHMEEAAYFHRHMQQKREQSRHFVLNQQMASRTSAKAAASKWASSKAASLNAASSNAAVHATCAIRASDVIWPCQCAYLRDRCPMYQYERE